MMARRPKGQIKKYQDEMWLQRRILGILNAHGPMTVRDLAQKLEWPEDEIMMYLMAMRRYGLVEEAPKERREFYFRYGIK